MTKEYMEHCVAQMSAYCRENPVTHLELNTDLLFTMIAYIQLAMRHPHRRKHPVTGFLKKDLLQIIRQFGNPTVQRALVAGFDEAQDVQVEEVD